MVVDSTRPSWTNWSGRLTCDAELVHVRSEEEAVAVAEQASRDGRAVRAAGSGHSHMPLVPSDDVIVDTSALSGVVAVDRDARTAWVRAGTTIAALGGALRSAGLALANQGDIDRQAIAGATATGTHGTGLRLTNLSAAVVGARIATSTGEVAVVDASAGGEAFEASRLHLGALGIVTQLQLALRDAYVLRERRVVRPFADAEPELADLPERSRHYEFFWLPDRDLVVEKFIDETDDEPVHPIGPEGRRVGWSHEVLPSHRPWPHTEMEYSVPLDAGPTVMAAIRTLVMTEFADMPWAIEYRTVAADEVWLSTAYRRPTVTISLHHDVAADEEPFYRRAEQIFAAHDGRPHWGKVNHLDGGQLGALHERWNDWWRARDQLDPGGTFLNPYLRSIRP